MEKNQRAYTMKGWCPIYCSNDYSLLLLFIFNRREKNNYYCLSETDISRIFFFYHALSHYTVYGVTIKTTIASSERTVQCSNYKTYSATRVQINNKKRTIVTHKVTLVILITNVKKNVCIEP